MRTLYDDFVALYCLVDDIAKYNQQDSLSNNHRETRGRKKKINPSWAVTLLLIMKKKGFNTIRQLYDWASFVLNAYNEQRPSYQQFVKAIHDENNLIILVSVMTVIMQLNRAKGASNVGIVDATKIEVCSLKFENQCALGLGLAKKGKTGDGFFYGFKVHAIINRDMEFLSFSITPGNVADISAFVDLVKNLECEWIVGDKGYIGASKKVKNKRIKVLTPQRKNMAKLPATPLQLELKSLRSRIESVWSVLKERMGLIYRTSRSIVSFFLHIIGSITAYSINKIAKSDVEIVQKLTA